MANFDDVEPNLEPVKQSAARVRKPAVAAEPVKRVRIMLEEADDIPPTGQFVGVNGVGYILRPGEPMDVPISVKEVLDNAIVDVPQLDSSQQIVGTRPKMRYPYRLVNS